MPSQSTVCGPSPGCPWNSVATIDARLLDVDAHRHVLRQRERQRQAVVDAVAVRRDRAAATRRSPVERPVDDDVGRLRDALRAGRRGDDQPVAAVGQRAELPVERVVPGRSLLVEDATPSDAPLASSTCAVTSAGPPSVKLTVAESPVPSAAGAITVGVAARFVSDSGVGGGGGGADLPSVPVATRDPGRAIVHV